MMGAGETIAMIALAVVLIGLLIAVTEMFGRFLKYKERRLAAAEQATRDGATNAELEERVRVLERIVTERGFDLGTQIEALRGQRRMEQARPGDGSGRKQRERSRV
jgi:predicted histidine transporter YuiF (NhaC family)